MTESREIILRQMLVQQSVNFAKTITKLYGPEKGLEIWETLADAVDNSLKLEVFTAMIIGSTPSEFLITLVSADSRSNRVATIKMVRLYSGFGLKEAKDVVDKVTGYYGGNGSPQSFRCIPSNMTGDITMYSVVSAFAGIGATVEMV